MPNRILYEKVCVSQTIASLTVEEERFFYRLLVKCDDFGRHHAHPSLLRAACFPLMLEQVTDAMVQDWLASLERANLVRVYRVDGRDYLSVATWRTYQRMRATSSKYPEPPFREHPHADARESGQMPPVSGDDIRERERDAEAARARPLAADAPPTAASAHTGHDELSNVPAPVTGFHALMIGTQGYAPSPAFFEQVTERYGSLDLREEALKMRAWLADPKQNRRQKRATQNFILGWLKRELSERPAVPPSRNGNGSAPSNLQHSPVNVRTY